MDNNTLMPLPLFISTLVYSLITILTLCCPSRIHLPTGQIVEGGFQKSERLDCVLSLARSLYKPDMRGKVHLRFMNEAAPMIEGFQESSLTLAELGCQSKVTPLFSTPISDIDSLTTQIHPYQSGVFHGILA